MFSCSNIKNLNPLRYYSVHVSLSEDAVYVPLSHLRNTLFILYIVFISTLPQSYKLIIIIFFLAFLHAKKERFEEINLHP